jgi:uncharacterized protein (DUF111 family)
MLLLATVDDISGIIVPHAIDKLMEVGAKSVHVSQTVTKKGRVGLLFIVDVSEEDEAAVGESLMTELGSLGYNVIRTEHVHSMNHMTLHRVIVQSDKLEHVYKVNIKSSTTNGKMIKTEPEVEDLSAIVDQIRRDFDTVMPLRKLINKVKEEINKGEEKTVIKIK